MKALIKTAPIVAALCLAAWPAQAADGILIVEKVTTNGTTTTSQIQIEKNRMRAENMAGNKPQVVVFDGTAQIMRIVNPEQKTYSEITQADVDRLAGQMQAALAQMQDQLKNVPEAQRAQIEAMMRGRGLPGATAPAKPDFRKVGTDKVGKWTCDKYEGYQNGQKTSEVCTVDPKALGFNIADFDVTKEMIAFFSKLAPQNANQMFSIGDPEKQGFAGVPVRRISYGGVQITSELTDVSRQNFADASYAVPAGFQKEESPFAAAAGRGRGGRGR